MNTLYLPEKNKIKNGDLTIPKFIFESQQKMRPPPSFLLSIFPLHGLRQICMCVYKHIFVQTFYVHAYLKAISKV